MAASSDLPISEQYRLAASHWAGLEAAADLLENCKSAVFSQKVTLLGEMPVSRAEHLVKASPDWSNHIVIISEARQAANTARIEVDYLKMLFQEHMSQEANARAEMRL